MTTPMVHPSKLLRPYDGPTDIAEQMKLASLLAEAHIGISPAFHGDPGGVIALMYRAQALNVPLMVAADNLVFDKRGTCSMRARLMKALVTVRAGHRIIPVECTDKRAVMRLEYSPEDGRAPFEAEWTLATAQAAGLVKKDNSPWVVYSATMLYWRATAKVVGMGCPEVTIGIGITEALDPDDPDDDTARPAPVPEEVVLTDTDGRPIPDGTVTDILNTVSIKDPTTGRPLVKPDVTIDDIREAWNVAGRQPEDGSRPIERFAWADGDDHYRLGHVLSDLVEQVTTRDAEHVARAAATTTVQPNAKVSMDAPAGTGTLPCGCDAAIVAKNGTHTEACTR